MDAVLLGARLILAVVFGVAGIAKLRDQRGSREALEGFGVPDGLARPLGVLLPLAEIVTAALLLPVTTAWWGGVAALALLLVFVAGIGINLARGKKPDCHCFGQLYSKPVGAETLIRNGVLAVMAAVIVLAGPANPGASAVGWLGDLGTFERVVVLAGMLFGVLLAGLGWLLFEAIRQQGRLLLRIDALEARLDGRYVGNGPLLQIETGGHGVNGHGGHAHHGGHDHGGHDHGPLAQPGLPIGAPAPDVSLPDLDGEPWTLDRLTEGGTPAMLLFVDPNCGACNGLLPEVARWQREHADTFKVALVSRGTAAENRRKVAEHEVGPVLLQTDFEVANAFGVPGTPSAAIVTADGAIGSALAVGADEIRALATRSFAGDATAATIGHVHPDSAPDYGVALRAPAPAFELPDLDGIKVSSEELRGQRTLLLFWSSGCGFCQQMLPDLKAWEETPPPRAPRLVLISSGSPDDDRALGLRAPILTDAMGATARAYGANGTPMAILVDGQGRIASKMAGGGPGCLALAGYRPTPQPA